MYMFTRFPGIGLLFGTSFVTTLHVLTHLHYHNIKYFSPALRNTNGSFILNGDWKFSGSRSVEAAGTRFAYQKQDDASLETITAAGPLTTPVDIMVR